MIILAIETSCDDTSIAIFENEKLLSMDTKSQIKIHNITGGVVPEIAAREHANSIFSVFQNVLNQSKKNINDIDYIAVTSHPGLIPSLLTGCTFARTLAKIINKKLILCDHIEGHIFSNFLDRNISLIKFPLVCLTVSGGHNDIYFMNSMWDKEKIGKSNDDAAGESYDKVARMMGLGYPGGPIISKLSSEYKNKNLNLFPRVFLNKNSYDFSFSGLKSAVKREIEKRIKIKGSIKKEDIAEISYEFQNAVNEVLAQKLISAAIYKKVNTVMLAGGVSANNDLKEKISYLSKKNNLNFIYPKKNLYCMDNAAMIGILAYLKITHKKAI